MHWERAWTQETWTTQGRVWAGSMSGRRQGRGTDSLVRSVSFGVCVGDRFLCEVGGHSQEGQLGHGLWSSPATLSPCGFKGSEVQWDRILILPPCDWPWQLLAWTLGCIPTSSSDERKKALMTTPPSKQGQ